MSRRSGAGVSRTRRAEPARDRQRIGKAVHLRRQTRRAITKEDVRAICSASRQAVIWELTDALGARRTSQAIAALENLLDAGEQPIGVLMMLVAQFRLMLLAQRPDAAQTDHRARRSGRQLRVREGLRAPARAGDGAFPADEGRRAAQCLAAVPLRARGEEFLHGRIDSRDGFAVGSEPPTRLHATRRPACHWKNDCQNRPEVNSGQARLPSGSSTPCCLIDEQLERIQQLRRDIGGAGGGGVCRCDSLRLLQQIQKLVRRDIFHAPQLGVLPTVGTDEHERRHTPDAEVLAQLLDVGRAFLRQVGLQHR